MARQRRKAPAAPTGLPYGQRKQLEEQQAAVDGGQAPEAPEARAARLRSLAAPPAPGEPNRFPGVFGPTTRPGEAATTGLPTQEVTDDPEIFLRVAYQKFKHPSVMRLLRRR